MGIYLYSYFPTFEMIESSSIVIKLLRGLFIKQRLKNNGGVSVVLGRNVVSVFVKDLLRDFCDVFSSFD